ncbi:MAG: hypothetical protein V1913_10975 [Fibrobacterota bacterium]
MRERPVFLFAASLALLAAPVLFGQEPLAPSTGPSAPAAVPVDTIPAPPPKAVLPEERCFDSYRQGEYERTVDCLSSLLYTGEIADTARLVPCYEYLGVSLSMIEKKDLARTAFKKLLALKPGYELNPNVYLPDIISLYQITKFEHILSRRVLILDTVPAYSRALNYLPLAVPQFMNKENVKGGLVLGLQAAALTVSIVAYQRQQRYYSPDYGYREENVADAHAYNLTQKISLLTFLSAYVYSIIDGFMHKPITLEHAAAQR